MVRVARVLTVAVVALLALTSAFAANIIDPADCTAYPCLIFEDEFDFLDNEVWEHELTQGGGGNFEFQAYINNRSISYTHDSTLFIKPDLMSNWKDEAFLSAGTFDQWGMNGENDVCTSNQYDGCEQTGSATNILTPAISARLRTVNDFSFRYGRVEVRAKMPRGDWIWPAIWMLPRRWPYGPWPASGEIDIVESRGNENYGNNNDQSNKYAGTTLHWGPFWPNNRYDLTTNFYESPIGSGVSYADEFHVWALEWTQDHISMTVNDVEMLYVDPVTNFFEFGGFSDMGIENPWVSGGKMAPFDQKFYLIMNVAVGGTGGFFPDGVPSTPSKPWSNGSPTARLDFWNARGDWYPTWEQELAGTGRTSENAALQVDYVRVYKLDSTQ